MSTFQLFEFLQGLEVDITEVIDFAAKFVDFLLDLLAMELFLDARLAAAAGVLTGTMGAMLAPMLSRPVPPRREDGSLTET